MTEMKPTVYVVDDDPAVRESMGVLLHTVGLSSRGFASARDFLSACDPQAPGCVILDLRLPGMSGIELQQEMERRGLALPIIFLTAYADVPTAVGAVRAGAVDFLQKPVDGERLLTCIRDALNRDAESRARRGEAEGARARLAPLTPRELEVLRLVVRGHTNKVVARAMGISRRTVETHRARIMRKTGARSLPELIRIVEAARLP